MKKIILLVFIIGFLNSCAFLFEDPINPEKEAKMDAYSTVSNYHTIKQMVLI